MRSHPPQVVHASESPDEAESKLAAPQTGGGVPDAMAALATPPLQQADHSSTSMEIARARHVLLVDDDPSIVRSLSRVLRARGYLTSTASNGAEAVRLVTQVDFDAILTDMFDNCHKIIHGTLARLSTYGNHYTFFPLSDLPHWSTH